MEFWILLLAWRRFALAECFLLHGATWVTIGQHSSIHTVDATHTRVRDDHPASAAVQHRSIDWVGKGPCTQGDTVTGHEHHSQSPTRIETSHSHTQCHIRPASYAVGRDCQCVCVWQQDKSKHSGQGSTKRMSWLDKARREWTSDFWEWSVSYFGCWTGNMTRITDILANSEPQPLASRV